MACLSWRGRRGSLYLQAVAFFSPEVRVLQAFSCVMVKSGRKGELPFGKRRAELSVVWF